MNEKVVRVKYVKSCIGYSQKHKSTMRALGLKRLGDEVKVRDTGAMRGMLRRVSHLIEVAEE